jgi:hypothetical protein
MVYDLLSVTCGYRQYPEITFMNYQPLIISNVRLLAVPKNNFSYGTQFYS